MRIEFISLYRRDIDEFYYYYFLVISDGFNGPNAPDFLLSKLYFVVHKKLKGLLWNDKFESPVDVSYSSDDTEKPRVRNFDV